jgi:hypothetical protein
MIMQTKSPLNLTEEEISWGRIYTWIHRRAEMLRQREAERTAQAEVTSKEAASESVSEAESLAASAPPGETEQQVDSTAPEKGGQV